MNVTKVSIRHVDMNKVRAIASITIDDDFVVHDLRVVEGERGLFVAMPSRKLPSGNFRDVAHPINSETREMVQNMVLVEYKSSLEDSEDTSEKSEISTQEPVKKEETPQAETAPEETSSENGDSTEA